MKKVNGKFVHKCNQDNILISNVTYKDGYYIAYIVYSQNNQFFFENERNHLPGILLIEAVRQKFLATLHIYFDVGEDKAFLMDGFTVEFKSYASLKRKVIIKTFFEKNKRTYAGKTELFQDGRLIAKFSSSCTVLSKKAVMRMEKSIEKY